MNNRIGWALLCCIALAACDTGSGVWSDRAQDRDPYLPINSLLVRHACSNCHAADYPRVGPAMTDIAAVSAAAGPAERARLVTVLLNGGKGRWGEAIMPAQKQLSSAEAQKLVDAIMVLKRSAGN